jgi:hypothetical protein
LFEPCASQGLASRQTPSTDDDSDRTHTR